MAAKLSDLLEAPCCFCKYNGPGYFQKHTHEKDCPWHDIGGMDEREKELIMFAGQGRLLKNITRKTTNNHRHHSQDRAGGGED